MMFDVVIIYNGLIYFFVQKFGQTEFFCTG